MMYKILSFSSLVLFVFFIILPFIWTLAYSLGVGPSVQSLSLAAYSSITDSLWTRPLQISFYSAFFSSLICTCCAIICADFLVQTKRSILTLSFLVIVFMLVVPPIVLAIGYLFFFSKIGLLDSISALIICNVALALPYTITISLILIRRSNLALRKIARMYGANNLIAFFTVTLPEVGAGFLVCFFISFILSFDESIVSYFITTIDSVTISKRMFDGIRYDLDPTISAISSVIILFWFIIGLIASRIYMNFGNRSNKNWVRDAN